jgi:hypothetical protein
VNREQRRQWRRYVFGCDGLTLAQRFVLLALETFADFPDGTNARPGRMALAEMCGCGERVVDSALHHGRRLELIEQTERANPKLGRVAVYRLLSTRTSVQVEADFNSHETSFNSHEDVISTRTPARATNRDTPIHNTNKEQHARARVAAVDPLGAEAATPGAELVQQIIPAEHPDSVRTMLRIKASALINGGTPPDVVADALRLWLTKPKLGPGVLPSLVSEVIKSRNGSPTPDGPTAYERKTAKNLAVFQQLADHPLTPEIER